MKGKKNWDWFECQICGHQSYEEDDFMHCDECGGVTCPGCGKDIEHQGFDEFECNKCLKRK